MHLSSLITRAVKAHLYDTHIDFFIIKIEMATTSPSQ